MSILETNKIQPFDGDNITLSAPNNIQIQANLHVSGTVTAETFQTTTVQTTVLAQSGSTQLGNSADDTHTIIGAVSHTGNTSQTGNFTLTGEVTQSGDYKLTGDLLHTGNIEQTGNSTLTGTGSFVGRVEHTGNSEHTGDSLHTGNSVIIGKSEISGSLEATGSIINKGIVQITGSLETSGRVSLLNYPWPLPGSETHIIKTDPFTVNTLNGGRDFEYLGMALEHVEGSLGSNQHNSLSIYAFDNHETINYGSRLNVSPLRTDMRIFASGSDSIGNLSISDRQNGETMGLLYADLIQIGVSRGSSIAIGNINSATSVRGELFLSCSSVTSVNAITASAFLGEVKDSTVFGATVSSISSSLADRIVNLTAATSASDAVLTTDLLVATASIAVNEGHINSLHTWTASLDNTYATDAELAAVSASFSTTVTSISDVTSSYALGADLTIATSSIAVNQTRLDAIAALTASLVSTETAYNLASGSYITSASLAADYVSKDRLKAIVTGSVDFAAFQTAILTL